MSWLETELHEQPAALARLIERQAAHVEEVAAAFRRDDVQYILIASRGSSSNAARYAQYLLGRAQRVPVMFATPSLYTIYEQPPRLAGAVVLGISQSGASPDVISVLAEARRQGRPTVSITNALDSPIAKESDAVLLLEAGEERSVAATKTYMNSLGAIALLFSAIDGTTARDELDRMPGVLERQIALSFATARLDQLAEAAGATVVARGVNYGTAHEVALKIRELSGLVVEAYSPADLLHGPIAAIRPGWPVIVVAPTGPARPSVEDVLPALEERGARVFVISDAEELLERAARRCGSCPACRTVQPDDGGRSGQAMGLRLAQLRGLTSIGPSDCRRSRSR